MLGQNTGVRGAELDHQVFLVIVGHEGDIHWGKLLSLLFDTQQGGFASLDAFGDVSIGRCGRLLPTRQK